MSSNRPNAELKRRVADRARGCCEHFLSLRSFSPSPFVGVFIRRNIRTKADLTRAETPLPARMPVKIPNIIDTRQLLGLGSGNRDRRRPRVRRPTHSTVGRGQNPCH